MSTALTSAVASSTSSSPFLLVGVGSDGHHQRVEGQRRMTIGVVHRECRDGVVPPPCFLKQQSETCRLAHLQRFYKCETRYWRHATCASPMTLSNVVIYLTHKIFILNYVFTIVFYLTR
jgi:hypothetical protein